MDTKFKQALTIFYDKVMTNPQHSHVFKNAAQHLLTYVQLQFDRKSETDNDSQEIKSFESATNSLSTDTFHRVIKMFHSTRFQATFFFCYFLQVLKNNKRQYLEFVLQKIHEKLLKVRKRVTNDQKKRFETKFNTFADKLMFLSQLPVKHFTREWFYYEVFLQFESECSLLSQLLSSTSDELQSLQYIKFHNYATLMNLLKSKCSLFDRKTRESKVFGTGEISIYICRKVDSQYFVLTQKQFELQLKHIKRNVSEKHKKIEVEEKGTNELKKYSNSKFKEQILGQLQKLKQEYEINTAKIASLFNFKDRIDVSKPPDESKQA